METEIPINVLSQQLTEKSPGNLLVGFFFRIKYFPMWSRLQGINTAYLKLSKHYVVMLYITGIKTFETVLIFCQLKFSWHHSSILSVNEWLFCFFF